MENNTAISIKGVKKMYRLGQIGGGTLQGDLQSWWARKRGKEDPNSKIGSDQRLIGQTFMALNGIDLEIKQGEAVGIIGKNGAGKSTLLKLLSRVTAPTEGTIDIYGRITSMLEVGTGFHPEMTGRENVYMNGAILGMTRAEIDSKMDQIIEFSEVGDFIDTPVKRYSSGMYVKLAFSVAAHLDSEIMIMDEVLAVGDVAFQKKCLDKMSDASKTEGKTILYVSHNMATIRRLCTRCLVLNEGKVVFDGDVDQAINKYTEIEVNYSACIDYTKIPRLKYLRNTKIRVLKAEYPGKKTIVFEKNHKITIKLLWLNEQDVNNACLRIELLKIDRSPLGTSLLNYFYSGKKGEYVEAEFEIDPSFLIPGQYATNYTFFEKNEFGGNTDIDCVFGLYIEILNEHNLNWNEQRWGTFQLPDIKVNKINKYELAPNKDLVIEHVN